MLVLFNHSLTELQKHEAENVLGVEKFVYPPAAVSALWRNIPADREGVYPILEPAFHWIDREGSQGDLLLVQGDFGATCAMVNYALHAGLVPVYSTTVRRACERKRKDGTVEVMHEFRHVRFREYGK